MKFTHSKLPHVNYHTK